MKKGYVILLAAVALVLGTASADAQNRNEADLKLGQNMEIVMNLFRDINLFYVDTLDSDKMAKNAAAGITSKLDPYTDFIPAEEMEQFETMTTGKYGGIGSIVRQKGDYIYIAQPYKDSPADKAGLEIGDKIVAVDSTDAKGLGSQKVSSMLKGTPGTTVLVRVEKLYTGETIEYPVKRERISVPSVPYYGFVSDSVGYIRHDDFSEDCSTELRNAFMEMRASGKLKGLILDYRNNGGGILQEAVKIMSMFVPKGTQIVSMRGKLSSMGADFKTEAEPIDTEIPIVVLVGSSSASAAEIVSGAFQDLDRGVLVGQRTYGKGLVQSTRPVGYNSYVKITTAKYYIPSGRCIQAVDYTHRNEDGSVGVVPDSLIKEFATLGGRKVYDGGGVMPDIRLEPEYMSRFTLLAYAKGYIEDFGDLYAKKYKGVAVDPLTFKLSDKDYKWFAEFMQDKDMEYESETKKNLAALRKSAERERYLDSIEADLADIEKRLQDDKQSNLMLYRDQLTGLIEEDIVLRNNYQKGVIQHGLLSDKEVDEAVKLLAAPARYREIVTSQDTPRK